MNQTNLIKIIIIVAVLLGELAVWTFPAEQDINQGAIPQVPDNPVSQEVPDNPVIQEVPDVETVEKPEPGDDRLLILVNKEHGLEKDYIPGDLKPVEYYATDRSAEGRFMRAEAAEQFNKMALAAEEAGYEIVMTTAYRSYGFQSVLYNNYVAEYGQAEADKFSAKPGYSEHQTGLAVDVSSPSVDYALTTDFDQTPEWAWLRENAEHFGFILRYPKGKTEITGYMYEAWHFRYVGLDAAKIINDENITLEEYIDKYLNI